RDVLVLERANAWLASEPRLTAEVRAAGVGGRLISAIAGFGGAEVLEEDLLELARTFDDRTGPVWVGADFAPDLRSDPKRAAIREELRRAFPGAERHGVRADRVSDRAPGDVLVPPARARRVPENAAPWSSLPSAWDGFVRPWSEGRAAALAPDPLLALAALPAGAGALRPVANVSGQLPAFDPAACTGCGRCWVSCPHGAIEPVVHGAAGLLNEGMRLAREQGGSVDVLRSVSSKLAREVEARLAAADAPATFDDALEQAFRAIEGSVPDERRANVAAAVAAVGAAVGALPVARPEALEGNIASIVVDPDACTGCGICATECEPEALRLEEATAESAGALRARTDLALAMAPTDAAIRERLAARDDVGVAAATWLDPEARHALGPGDAAPAGSPARLGLRLALGALSAAQAQRDVDARARVRAVRERAAKSIRHAMLDVVPTGDLEAISRGLESLGGRDVDVAALVSRLEEAVETGPVNAERLARVVDRAKSVVDLDERLARATGPGRRTYVVVADRDLAEWIATFPAQPFPGPAIVDLDGAGIATASGLLDEIARETVENARAIRRVEHALTGSAAPDPPDLPARFEDLRLEEQALAPRVVLLLDDESWTERRGGAVESLLARRLPLAVIVTAGSAGGDAGRSELALLAAAGRDAFVVQDTVADPDPLVRAIRDAATKGGPLLVRVFAPRPDGEAAAALERIRQRRDAGEFVPFLASPSERAPLGTITLRDGPASSTRDVLLLLAGSAGPAIERARDEARDEERRRAVAERSTALDAATHDTESALVERLERRLMALAGPDSEDDA
ncbi:MAG: 4Fe-4S binding protein, partial [Gemmatimonadetes bacterium]|nr:4Fe-4S binding protein [Gemmatimonadota bacterium]